MDIFFINSIFSIKSMGFFSNAQRQLTPQSMVRTDQISNSSELLASRHFSLLNANAAGACGYDFLCDGGRLVRAYVRLRRGAI